MAEKIRYQYCRICPSSGHEALAMDRRESTASQETFTSLQQLDPSPIESPEEDLEKQLGELPRSVSPPKTTHLGLSGSGQHGTTYYREYLPIANEEK
ncbi:hypothetical protein M7I_3340 [Glarea lozoyensis 74030]|uniref:Uncharacterized protein n=1 Tax=Glarea lozoyensis (strain ATCC 74030 / MF5533) TaxID=1104152 RepID=H0EL80_GLAL7|nr:hypothetical protein M7I_3340 [Glarea lozoyensis 74030]